MVNDYSPKIVWRDIDSITPYALNNKKHPDDQIAKIASSIAEFGFDQPIVLDGDGIIIKGHGRYLASRKLGLRSIPVMIRTDLTHIQIKAARIADNRVALSEWDTELLGLELAELNQLGFDLGKTGFDASELSNLIYGVEDPISTMPVDEDEPEPVTCPECGHKFKA